MHSRLSLAGWFFLFGCSGSGTSPEDTGVQDTGEVTDTGSPADTGVGTDTGGVTDTGDTPPADVRIVRDDFGVPHIEADTFEAAMYGLGRTMAEDRLFQMEVRRLRASGRLSEFFAVPKPATNDDQDLNERLLNLCLLYTSDAADE